MSTLKYKGYEGTAEVNIGRKVCCGKVLFIKDLVTYEAQSPTDLQTEFERAVDDYIQTCRQLEKIPEVPRLYKPRAKKQRYTRKELAGCKRLRGGWFKD